MPNPLQRESDRTVDSSPPSSGLDCCLPRSRRMVRSALFSETFAQRKKWVGRYMVLWRRSGADAALRLGVISSKKVHRRANRRNLARRRLREAFRILRPRCTGSYDVILVARNHILEASQHEVEKELETLAKRAGLLASDQTGEQYE